MYYDVKEIFIHPARRTPGVLYAPAEASANSKTAVLVMHSDEDYLTFSTGRELAKRGFLCLCANVPGKEGFFWTQCEKMQAIDTCVRYLRDLPGVRNVVLMGHSGGATTMSAYQAIAENGVQIFQGPEKIVPHPDCGPLAGADGIMLLDPNMGNCYCQLCSLDPAVLREDSGKELDPDLDLYNPDNGYVPNGCGYTEDFIAAFMRAQSRRNMRILDAALQRYEALEKGEGLYEDDEPFILPGAAQGFFNNKEFVTDTHLAHTAEPHTLVHSDGSVTTQIVLALAKSAFGKSCTPSLKDGARIFTVKNYLTSYAVRTDDSFASDESHFYGIDWSSTYNSAVPNMEHVMVPTLITGMTAGVNVVATETIWKHAAAKDKDLAYIEGADHLFEPAKELESFPGQFGDTMKLHHDYVAQWLSAPGRFKD